MASTTTAQQRQALLKQRQQAAHHSQQLPAPAADLSENDQYVRLQVDLPGVFSNDLEVDITDGVLTLRGVRKTFSIDGSVCTKKHKFSRRYAIDTNVVDVSGIKANLAYGVLTIRAPKKSAENIPVHVAANQQNKRQLETHTAQVTENTPNAQGAPVQVQDESSGSDESKGNEK